MRTFLVILFVAIVTLIIYNPTMEDFDEYVDETLYKDRMNKQTSVITHMFDQETLSSFDGNPVTSRERNNYFVLSTYKISLTEDIPQAIPLESNYLGIASMFFEIGHSNNLDAHAADP